MVEEVYRYAQDFVRNETEYDTWKTTVCTRSFVTQADTVKIGFSVNPTAAVVRTFQVYILRQASPNGDAAIERRLASVGSIHSILPIIEAGIPQKGLSGLLRNKLLSCWWLPQMGYMAGSVASVS